MPGLGWRSTGDGEQHPAVLTQGKPFRAAARLRASVVFGVAAFALSAAGPALSAQVESLHHDQVRAAVLDGRLAPLETILGAVRSTFERQIIDVRALQMDDAYLYEILILEADGAVLQLYYNGQTAELVAWTGVGAGEKDAAADFAAEVFARLFDKRDEAGGR